MTSTIPEPYCTFSDHTLAVRVLHVGTGRGVDCRVFTGALDGCIKVWALSNRTWWISPASVPTWNERSSGSTAMLVGI
jgi:hypothetical protein